MMKTFHKARSASLACGLIAFAGGCGGAEQAPAQCPEGNEVAGQCAGVPEAPICDGDACTSGVDCAEIVAVNDGASLAEAAGEATAGTCIALAPGAYPAVSLPGGVSLLGKSAASVTVAGVAMGSGKGAVLRGVAIGSGGVQVAATTARIESVLVSGGVAAGIEVAPGAMVTVVTSTIAGGPRHGIFATDGAVVTVERSLIEDNEGAGLWSMCSSECACLDQPVITLEESIVRLNHVGGVVAFSSTLAMDHVDIIETQPGDDWSFGMGGGGLTAAFCSSLTATGGRVMDSRSYGVLVDDSSATLSGVEISGNVIGFWAQHISQSGPQTVTVEDSTIKGNEGVGIGVDGDSVGLIICRSAVSGTTMSNLLVAGGSSAKVGDGLLWLGGSQVDIEGLSLSSNARASLVIDGAASGSLADVELSGGDEEKGIVQQNYSGGDQPTAGMNVPPIKAGGSELFTTPAAPSVVPSNL